MNNKSGDSPSVELSRSARPPAEQAPVFMYLQTDSPIVYKCHHNNKHHHNNNNNNNSPFKVMNVEAKIDCNSNSPIKRSVDVRNEEVLALKNKFPTKIPIILQRFAKEVHLPHLDKCKYLVPQEITMSQFQTIIRNRMQMSPNQALYLLVNNRSMLSMSLTLAEVYHSHAGPDGFLYITYASQEVFGTSNLQSYSP